MNSTFQEKLIDRLSAQSVEIVEEIQQLWSGYGRIVRLKVFGGPYDSLIMKEIKPPTRTNHPRGWNTSTSHERKLKSYEIETNWYENYSSLCDNSIRIPKLILSNSDGQVRYLILEDLDLAGYPIRKSRLNKSEVKTCLSWLANFHARFMSNSGEGLWDAGCYWHLDTRQDELKEMADSELKEKASELDLVLKKTKYQTLVHGDAKVANFCFSEEGSLAAVDFQYIGCGCGMKDVIYFLGSCLDEVLCEEWETELLNHYFEKLRKALENSKIELDLNELENEWRELYPIAWADFNRFLLGWMPSHQKLHAYSNKMTKRALKVINQSFK